MNGRLLMLTAKYLSRLILAFSIIILLRGHDLPGGGFIGGLTAAVAFALYLMAFGSECTREKIYFDPRSLIGCGLLLSIASALYPVLYGGTFFEGLWANLDLPTGITLGLGTPILFDVGVYLVVSGTLMIILFSLVEE